MAVFENNVELKATPTEGSHVTNVDYVKSRSVTISWSEYQALSEEEKNNGTSYYIPDMPVSASGEVIGDGERLNGYLASAATVSIGGVIPFVAYSNSNMTITDGFVTLKKGRTYNIFCDIRFLFSQNDSYVTYSIKDSNGNKLSENGVDISTNRDVSIGSHIAISLTISPSEDIDIAAYITDGKNITNVQAGSSKLTITEIPSLQACIDVTDEHIKEVASGGIADIPLTDIEIDTTKLTKCRDYSAIQYEVRNGICYVTLMGVGVVNTGTTEITNNFPKCSVGIKDIIDGYFVTTLQVASGDTLSTKSIFLAIMGDSLQIISADSLGPFWGSLIYPVRES